MSADAEDLSPGDAVTGLIILAVMCSVCIYAFYRVVLCIMAGC